MNEARIGALLGSFLSTICIEDNIILDFAFVVIFVVVVAVNTDAVLDDMLGG